MINSPKYDGLGDTAQLLTSLKRVINSAESYLDYYRKEVREPAYQPLPTQKPSRIIWKFKIRYRLLRRVIQSLKENFSDQERSTIGTVDEQMEQLQLIQQCLESKTKELF